MQLWVDKLVSEYGKERYRLLKYRKTLDRQDNSEQEEFEIIGGMISDMQFAMDWIRTGRRPGSRRGAEQFGIYRRTELEQHFPRIVPAVKELSVEEKQKILDILLSLSARERQCFILHLAYGLTYANIADKLGVSKNTVRVFVDRAKSKVQQGFS